MANNGKDILIDSLSKDLFPFTGQILTEMRLTNLTAFKYLAKAFDLPFNLVNKVSTDKEVAEIYLMQEEYTGWLPGQLAKLKISWNSKWEEFEKYLWFCYRYGGVDHGDNAKGLLWNVSVHASGVILYPYEGTDILPKNSQGVTYRGHQLEEMNYIKYDILGIKNLDPLSYFIPIIEKDTGKKFNWEDNSDPETWKVFQNADTDFVFQFSSPGMKKALKTVKPSNITKLAELNSLYRPGCINAGIFDRYLKDDWTEEEKVVGKFLKEEFGEEHSYAMIFQEDIMKVVQKMAGFTLADADLVRRAMQRKELDRMLSYKEQFLKGFKKDIYGDIGEIVWDTIEAFATYTFNKSHSVAYACLAYWTAYIFCHYKKDYFEFLLNLGSAEEKKEVISYLSKNHKIIFPNLETKNTTFKVTDTKLLMPTESVVENPSIIHYLLNLDAEKKKMIVKYGILDSFCVDRKGLRELFSSFTKKQMDLLKENEDMLESETLVELLNKLSALEVLDYEDLGKKRYQISVHKPKSEKEICLDNSLSADNLSHNCQEDVRAYGIVREKYVSSLPPNPLPEIQEKFEEFPKDSDLDLRRVLKHITDHNYDLLSINREDSWYDVVMKESDLVTWPKATLVFSNGAMKASIDKRNTQVLNTIKSCDKNTPLAVRFEASCYLNKDVEPAFSLKIKEVEIR